MNDHFLRRNGRLIAAATLLLVLTGHPALAQAPVMNQSGSTAASASPPSEDIRDIRGPKPVTSLWPVSLIAIAVLLVAGGGYAAWQWDRRRQLLPSKLPSDIAIERLEKARALMRPAGGREFSIEVSSIVREYIETRFQVMAAHLTTHEFLHALLESNLSTLAVHRDLLGEFLQSCDLAKFGGWNLRPENMEMMLQGARRFVVDSARPRVPRTPLTKSPSAATRETYDSVPST
jgi:Domain of unknown function (DUF4381)